MAIRQLPFDKGQDFDITNKAARIRSDEVLANMENYLKDEKTLVVKCGKSFWDVTAVPEIYEAGEEFQVDNLTDIDRKQMGKQEPPKPAFVDTILQDPKANPLTALYHKTDEEEVEEEPPQLDRKTYYLYPRDVEALRILCHETHTEVSAMVREIFARGIPSIAEEIGKEDIYAEAEANLAKNGTTAKKKAFNRRSK